MFRTLLVTLVIPLQLAAQIEFGPARVDPSKPVPAKSDVLAAWQRRQDRMRSFQFSWTEQQTRPAGWIPNPRYPERDRLAIPGLYVDRTYTVSKSLAVDGNRMRYAFEIDRKAEPDGVDVRSPSGDTHGLGVERHYSYVSVFDGQRGEVRTTTFFDHPPPTVQAGASNVDAQNLDARVIMLALRPLDPVMGHLLVDRAITNERRRFYRGNSTFLLEERHDPLGWKTILWIEPERDFLVSRVGIAFEQKPMVDIDIDYVADATWGWIPTAWRITEMLANGSRRLVAEARVSHYSINQPIPADQFK
jgi:hypothetical protein